MKILNILVIAIGIVLGDKVKLIIDTDMVAIYIFLENNFLFERKIVSGS